MKPGKSKTCQAIRKLTRELPDVVEGISCKGTAIESLTFNRVKKAFLFASVKDGNFIIRFKLDESKASATKKGVEVGAGGWAKYVFPDGSTPRELSRWVDESYRCVGGRARKR